MQQMGPVPTDETKPPPRGLDQPEPFWLREHSDLRKLAVQFIDQLGRMVGRGVIDNQQLKRGRQFRERVEHLVDEGAQVELRVPNCKHNAE
jgi:hypothetical protein